jgi:hypothetical protein
MLSQQWRAETHNPKELTMETITIRVPYHHRHLHPEIKARGGRFDSASKTWNLPDTEPNRALAEEIQRPISAPTHEERVQNVLNVCVDLLNSLDGPGKRRYSVAEVGHKIVIELQPINLENS